MVAFLKCGILVPIVSACSFEIDIEIISYKFETDVDVRINEGSLVGVQCRTAIPVADIETEFRTYGYAPAVSFKYVFRCDISSSHIGLESASIPGHTHSEVRNDTMVSVHHGA